ncbi:hypothetical protein [Cesiribacter andamanensis]|uniref:Outer membrane protein beta-barrel domain-containing protein n=1 Tax=Cesiribacter andamanensis AMV16 TaxID=1279009 RepID=M7N427_9BACT|nr:hypothetical protein [Cesiribacter andamanensis]EMR01966.1 hypothetical protein ADICEAN_02901 [Cesiribacter andamanensis AMV16]
MKAPVLLLLLAMALPLSANGQEIRGISANLTFGLVHVPHAPTLLNATAPRGIDHFSATYYGFGLDTYYRANRGLAAFDALVASQQPLTDGSRTAHTYLGTAQARLGWIVLQSRYAWLYPSVGLGVHALSLRLGEQLPASTVCLYHYRLFSPALDLGLNVDFLALRATEDAEGYAGRTLGLRLGYSFSPDRSQWQISDLERTGQQLPYAHRQVYLKVSVGIGAFVRN